MVRALPSVLRLGHRQDRDKRMTTHVGLTARAFGSKNMYLPKMDSKVRDTLKDVTKRFGGDFEVKETKNWKRLIKEWNGDVVHLTMYGSDIHEFFSEHDLEEPLMVVGSQKVPSAVYELSDHNVSVGNQPHSEVAALAVFLDRYNDRSIPDRPSGELGILPSREKKRVVDYSKVPSASECFEFARKRNMSPELMEHSIAVLDRALHLQKRHGGDLRLIIAGALLHDIGRTVTHGVEHGVEGSSMIQEKGWSDELRKIVERHIGGGITKEEAKEAGLPSRSYIPKTLEEKLICHADNTAGGEERFSDLIKRVKRAGHEESAERMRSLAKEFEEIL